MHDNSQDDALNIDQSYNTPQIPLTDKTQEKHRNKVLNPIEEIRSQLKNFAISMQERLTFVEKQMRETKNDSQPNTPKPMNNQTDDTTHQTLVNDLLKACITELEKQVADKNCIIECLTKI